MMPENKPMKMQWLNIDGRQVPSILPNHWNEQKNDWDITGTKNPLPVANYTQNASGVWLPTSESNPVPTQLTGSNVEFGKKEEFSSREIIRSSLGTSRTKPVWAKGALIEVNVYNLVGHFDNNQGIRVSSFNRFRGGTGTGLRLRSPFLVNPGIIQHLWYPGGINLNDAESTNADFMMSNTPLSESLAVGLEIQGNFADGEGIDCEVNVYWMR